MRKTVKFFTIIAIVATGLFTGCVEDVVDENPPTISVTPSADTTDVSIGDSIDFTLSLGSGDGLVSLKTLQSGAGVEIINGDVTFAGESSQAATVTVKVTSDAADSAIITISFTVADGVRQASETRSIRAIKKATALTAAKDFTWKRVGGNDATGLATFGLKWTSNSATNAIIKKDATKFVELDPTAWSTIKNLEDLKKAVDAATDMTDWQKVSATANKTYDYTLATIISEKYFLIHVTSSTVEVSTVGSTITINGGYKE